MICLNFYINTNKLIMNLIQRKFDNFGYILLTLISKSGSIT
jgi:hypothetical protein